MWKAIRAAPERALGFEVVEPNTGDFLVKLKPDRKHSTDEVVADLRGKFSATLPDIEWDFPSILGDLIGDLTLVSQAHRSEALFDRYRFSHQESARDRRAIEEDQRRSGHQGWAGLCRPLSEPAGARRRTPLAWASTAPIWPRP